MKYVVSCEKLQQSHFFTTDTSDYNNLNALGDHVRKMVFTAMYYYVRVLLHSKTTSI